MNTWQEAVVQVIGSLIGLAVTYFGYIVVKNKTAVTALKFIDALAGPAVAAAQKLGLDKQLSGALQKSTAVQYVINGLAKQGFTKVDQQAIENAVELAYANLKATLDTVYVDKGDSEKDASVVADAPKQEASAPESNAVVSK